MILVVASLLAGALSVLAPCVVSILPVLLTRSTEVQNNQRRSAVFLIGGLAISIIVFSILLKSTTWLIAVPVQVWAAISGGIVLLFGVTTLFPGLWERMALALRLPLVAQRNMAHVAEKRGRWADVLLGASLGPVFSACSPTYALIVAVILPAEPMIGLGYLLAYVAGLVIVLTLITIFGRKLIVRLGWGINPRGIFRRILGATLIVVGLLILTGFDKYLLAWLVESGLFDWQIDLESGLTTDR
jgi:cytochrome c biogenesis protein CcdA